MKLHFCFLVLISLLASCFASCPHGCKCPSSVYVDCSNARLTSVPSQLPFTALGLVLNDNRITEIDASAFKTTTNLLNINLDNNRLSILSASNFIHLSKLENLSLANNDLSDVESLNTASFIHSLVYLNLAGNRLRKIPALQLTALKHLILSSNAIHTAAFPASFSSCFDLQSVDLSSNRIAGIAAEDLDSLEPLKVASLKFDDNRISRINPEALTAVGLSLKKLSLNRNRLTSAALASALKGFEKVPNIALVSLSVSSNAITKFDGSVLEPLKHSALRTLEMDEHRKLDLDLSAFVSIRKSLTVLSLRSCGLRSPFNAISPLSNLRTLRLDGNEFQALPSNLPQTLVELSMTRNGLQGWFGDVLSHLAYLKKLDLSNNRLETVTEKSANSLGHSIHRLQQLGLENNPFNCNDALVWFICWSRKSNIVRDFHVLRCLSPVSRTGQKLADAADTSHCDSSENGIVEHKSPLPARFKIAEILRIFLDILSFFGMTVISLTGSAVLKVLGLIPVNLLKIVSSLMGYDYEHLLTLLKMLP